MGTLGAAGGGSYQSSATSSASGKQTANAMFGDFNIGQGAGSGLKFNFVTLGLGALVAIAFFYFRK